MNIIIIIMIIIIMTNAAMYSITHYGILDSARLNEVYYNIL